MTAQKPKAPKPVDKKTVKFSGEPVEIRIEAGKELSPKQFDFVRAASGWKMSDLIEDNEPTGKMLAANLWLAIQKERPDVTPQQVYESEDLSEFGVQLVAEKPSGLDPTNAAG